MPLTERDIRKVINTKENSLEFDGVPSINNMIEGQTAIQKKSNSQLALYKKKFGKLWKSYMTSDGNQIVDKTLTTNTLQYTNKFIDYKSFMHNFEDDIGTTKHYLPWWGTTESSAGMDDHRVGFVTPFRMTLHKIIIRANALIASDDVTIRVEKQDADNTEDIVATAVYDVSAVGALASDTNFELNKVDFDNNPVVEAGKLCGLSIQPASDIVGGSHDWYITSVWRVEVVI